MLRQVVSILLMLSCLPIQAMDCHPKINPKRSQFIVGYGSLIDEQSKKRTDPLAPPNIPALIKGYKRSWAIHGNLPGLNTTFLSVFEQPNASFNGIIYQVSTTKMIEQYDKREAVYCRKLLSLDKVKVLAHKTTLPTHYQLWIYSAVKKPEYASHDYPIVQSYVDVFLRGCIQIEEKFKLKHFAENCIKTTGEWPIYWLNDRIFPRRPYLYEPRAAKIDRLLKSLLPQQFKQIKVE